MKKLFTLLFTLLLFLTGFAQVKPFDRVKIREKLFIPKPIGDNEAVDFRTLKDSLGVKADTADVFLLATQNTILEITTFEKNIVINATGELFNNYPLTINGANGTGDSDRYTAFFNGSGSDDGGVLIHANDENNDENALRIVNLSLGIDSVLFNMLSGGDAVFRQSVTSSGFIAPSLTSLASLSFNVLSLSDAFTIENVTGVGRFKGRMFFANVTDATDAFDGSVQLNGGLSVVKRIYAGGSIQTEGTLTAQVISPEGTDVDKFLVSNSGLIKYRTGSQLLSDIDGVSTIGYNNSNWNLAFDHIGEDGTSHTFINQDLKTSFSPTWAGGTFNGNVLIDGIAGSGNLTLRGDDGTTLTFLDDGENKSFDIRVAGAAVFQIRNNVGSPLLAMLQSGATTFSFSVTAATIGAANLTNTFFSIYDGSKFINSVMSQSGGNIDINGDITANNYKTITVSLDAAAVNGLGSAYTLISAQAGIIYAINDVRMEIDVATTLEVGSQQLNLKHGTDLQGQWGTGEVETSIDEVIGMTKVSNPRTAPNNAVTIQLSGSTNPSSGSVTMKFHITYREITISF